MIGFGQENEIVKLQNEIDEIHYKMNKHHKQFYTGATINAVGFGTTALGVVLSVNPLLYIGGAFVLSGNFVMLNSHKWFKYHSKKNKIDERIKQLQQLLYYEEITQEEYDKAIKDLSELKQ